MAVERMLPDAEAEALVGLAREIAQGELKPIASEYEAESRFPRDKFRLMGKSGLLGLPYPERWGGGDVRYEVYLQVLEEIAAAWMTVGVGLSVHTMACFPLVHFGSGEQRDARLPDQLEGDLLGAYALTGTAGQAAKVPQIFEGTNQIQRMVIARALQKGTR
jgi:alkylation response protein AidB-like acyl-CoA dehydrogenase